MAETNDNCKFIPCPFERQFGQWDERFINMDATLTAINANLTKQNGRIGKLENWKTKILGAWAVLSFLLMVIGVFFKVKL
jgi:hypothetical protein